MRSSPVPTASRTRAFMAPKMRSFRAHRSSSVVKETSNARRRPRTSTRLGTMSGDRGKHVEKGPGEVAAFGPFRLFPTARRLERDDKPVEIGGRALDVLIELVNQAGRVVSKAELMSTIWTDITVVEGVLRTHIYNLRR